MTYMGCLYGVRIYVSEDAIVRLPGDKRPSSWIVDLAYKMRANMVDFTALPIAAVLDPKDFALLSEELQAFGVRL